MGRLITVFMASLHSGVHIPPPVPMSALISAGTSLLRRETRPAEPSPMFMMAVSRSSYAALLTSMEHAHERAPEMTAFMSM